MLILCGEGRLVSGAFHQEDCKKKGSCEMETDGACSDEVKTPNDISKQFLSLPLGPPSLSERYPNTVSSHHLAAPTCTYLNEGMEIR
jgi:hypothetical protein